MILKNKNVYRTFVDDGGGEPPISDCIRYEINVLVPTQLTFNYIDCSDENVSVGLNEGVHIICSHGGPTTSAAPTKYTIAIDGEC